MLLHGFNAMGGTEQNHYRGFKLASGHMRGRWPTERNAGSLKQQGRGANPLAQPTCPTAPSSLTCPHQPASPTFREAFSLRRLAFNLASFARTNLSTFRNVQRRSCTHPGALQSPRFLLLLFPLPPIGPSGLSIRSGLIPSFMRSTEVSSCCKVPMNGDPQVSVFIRPTCSIYPFYL
jgi:hypothetical protein